MAFVEKLITWLGSFILIYLLSLLKFIQVFERLYPITYNNSLGETLNIVLLNDNCKHLIYPLTDIPTF